MFRRLTTFQLGVDLGIAGAYATVVLAVTASSSTFATLVPSIPGMTMIAAFGYPLLLATGLALRRLSPPSALAAAWAGAIVQMAGGLPPAWADIAIFAVLFATAAYGERTTYWAGLGSAVLGSLVVTVYLLGLVQGITLTARSLVALAIALGASLFALLLSWTAGALLRSRIQVRGEQRLAAVAAAASVASEERERIARDMHDVVAHSLAVVVAQADGARYAAATDPDASPAALETISATARAALVDVRLLLAQLRHQPGDGPQPTLTDVNALFEQMRSAGMTLAVEIDPAPATTPPAGVQLAVYRILQEALTNALRHGGGSPVWVRLSWHIDQVDIAVRNRKPVGAAAGTAGHGLIGITERARLVGGTASAGEHDEQFVVSASLPIGAS